MSENRRQLLQGNEAVAHGALAVGCRFFAGYPITPASEIAKQLATLLRDALTAGKVPATDGKSLKGQRNLDDPARPNQPGNGDHL